MEVDPDTESDGEGPSHGRPVPRGYELEEPGAMNLEDDPDDGFTPEELVTG